MEFFLKTKHNVYPVEVTIDHDNGRYTIRKFDSTGEYFNSPEELVVWIKENWNATEFQDKQEFEEMMKEIQVYMPIN